MDISQIRKLDIWILVTFDLTPFPNAFAFYDMEEMVACWDCEQCLGHFPTLFRKELFMLPGHPLYNNPNAHAIDLPISHLRVNKYK